MFDTARLAPDVLARFWSILSSLGDSIGATAIRLHVPVEKKTLLLRGPLSDFEALPLQLDVPVYLPDGSLAAQLQLVGSPAPLSETQLRLAEVMRDAIEAQLVLHLPQKPDDSLKAPSTIERQLQLSEQRFRLLVENVRDDYFMHDDKGRFLDVNEGACRNLGYSRDELLRMSAHDVSTDLSQAEKEELYRVTPPGASARVSAYHRRKDGTIFPVDVLITCHMLAGSKIFLGLVRDVSEQLEARQALEAMNAALEARVAERTAALNQSTELLQAIMDNAADAITLCDTEQRFLAVNPAACRILRRSREELIGTRIQDIVDIATMQAYSEQSLQALRNGETISLEQSLIIDGQELVLLITRSPRRDASGRVIGVVTLTRDITGSKLAERDLRIERERLSLAADIGGFGFVVHGPSDGLLAFSDEWLRIFGTEGKEQSIELMFSLIHPDDHNRVLEEFDSLLSGHYRTGVIFRILRPDGQLRWVTAAGRCIEASAFSAMRVIIVLNDITERYLAERALQASYDALLQAERLAHIGSWHFDATTNTFSASAMMREMNGVAEGEDISLESLGQMMPPDDFNRVGIAIRTCMQDGQPYTVDVQHYRPNGSTFAAEIRGQPHRNPEGVIIGLSGTVQDVSERASARAQMTAIADSLPNGAIYRIEHPIHVLDPDAAFAAQRDARITYISAGIEKLIGISAEALVADASLLTSAIHEEDRARYLASARDSMMALSVFNCDFRLIRPDGSLVRLQVRSAPRIMEKVRIWDGIILDVTEAYETAEALRLAKDKAEAAEHAKSDFLATMSHEIRTPMNSVIGMTRLALATELSPRQKNYLDKIDTSARILLAIINDILDLSRIEAGALALEEVEFSLDQVLATVTDTTALKADEKGIEFLYSVAPDVPRRLRGDPLRLGQVLINLVGNAVKFTDKGEVEISIDRLLPGPEQTERLRFAVRDTGIGMTEPQLAGLFRPFSQADSGTARRFGGTGLGLSICKQLVALMGGEIDVSSQPGEGTTFAFSIKLGESPANPVLGQQFYGNKRALIVDDVAAARETLSSMLEQFGIQCQTAASGAAALAALHKANAQDLPFDLVLMDWRMPGMDGVETARHIRNDLLLSHTPAVLMITAHAREEISAHVAALRLEGLLIKPVTESMLFNAVQHIFSVRSGTTEGKAETALAPISPEFPAIIRGRKVLVVDDNPFNLEVAKDFLELAGVDVTTAVSGMAALAALEQERFDAVLMDMQMPELDGLETTRRIRANPAWRDLPVIALTAQARVEDQELTKEVGMSAHLTKPVDESLLYATLAEVIAPATAAAAPSIDRPRALARMRNDPARLQRMLDLFLRDFSSCPEQARDLLHAGDLAGLSGIAHRVKGTVGYFAADALTAKAEALEALLHAGSDTGLAALALEFAADLEAMLAECRIWVQQLSQEA